MKWTKEEINRCLDLFDQGYSYADVAQVIGRSHTAVASKFNRMGIKSGFDSRNTIRVDKGYDHLDWVAIQKDYDTGGSFDRVAKKYKLHNDAIKWAKSNGRFTTRSRSEGIKLAWENKKIRNCDKESLSSYRYRCRFTFGVKSYPDWFDLSLIEKHGWYSPKNKGNNLGGVSRDHMVSVYFGYKNNIDPRIIGHPANCKLMVHSENSKKKNKSSITLEELKCRILVFEEIYGKY